MAEIARSYLEGTTSVFFLDRALVNSRLDDSVILFSLASRSRCGWTFAATLLLFDAVFFIDFCNAAIARRCERRKVDRFADELSGGDFDAKTIERHKVVTCTKAFSSGESQFFQAGFLGEKDDSAREKILLMQCIKSRNSSPRNVKSIKPSISNKLSVVKLKREIYSCFHQRGSWDGCSTAEMCACKYKLVFVLKSLELSNQSKQFLSAQSKKPMEEIFSHEICHSFRVHKLCREEHLQCEGHPWKPGLAHMNVGNNTLKSPRKTFAPYAHTHGGEQTFGQTFINSPGRGWMDQICKYAEPGSS